MGRPHKTVRKFRSEIVSAVEAAAFLDLNERVFYRMVEEGILPKAGSGEYILGDVTEAYWKARLGTEGLEAEQTRLTKAKADLAELELAEQRGEVHRASAVMRVWADNVTNAKTRLLSVPAKLAPELVGKELQEIQAKLKTEISEALNELADYDERRIAHTAAVFGQ
jgi:phage terminase Nu1 subunit (DNA packaging protein)